LPAIPALPEAGKSQVWGQPGLPNETLFQTNEKKKKKNSNNHPFTSPFTVYRYQLILYWLHLLYIILVFYLFWCKHVYLWFFIIKNTSKTIFEPEWPTFLSV
jgi:hypothetical protein